MPKKTKLDLISFRTIALAAFALVSIFLWVAAKPAAPAQEAETCGTCHEEVVKAFRLNPHAAAQANSCTACHDKGEKHLEEGGKGTIFAFLGSDLGSEKSKRCLSCHTKDSPRFSSSPHGKASLDCTTCHVIHDENFYPALLKTSTDKNCFACHQDIFALFQLNERHRLQEGILSCATCHDPHEPSARERLGGFKHESCLRCHTDKGGPFLYEHGASRIEGCTSCHEVHGSPNRRMLTYQSIADLCFSCHGFAPAWHSHFTSESSNCVTCHSTIHGSNLSKIFLK